MRVWIISWFGNDDVREKRKEIHKKQVEWFLKYGLDVCVFAQDYREEDYLDKVTYHVHEGPVLLPGDARNFLLERFYASDDDWGVFCDNDSVLYDDVQHMDGSEFLNFFPGHLDLSRVDYFLPMNPQQTPFSAFYEENRVCLSSNLMFSRTHKGKGSLFFLKNIRKHKGVEVFFNQKAFTDSSGKIVSGEDINFVFDLIAVGCGTYECKNILLKEWSATVSTWAANPEERKESIGKFKEIMESLWGISRKGDTLDFSSWVEETARAPKKLLVEKPGVESFF